MTWKAMSAERACDLVDFWIAAPWPLTPVQVQQLGEQLGWTPDEDDAMQNEPDGLSEPAVPIIDLPSGETGALNFWVTDVVGDPSQASTDFLHDRYTLLVREGGRRWGVPMLSTTVGASARWDLDGGARVVASRGERSVAIDFYTPQYAAILRDLGE